MITYGKTVFFTSTYSRDRLLDSCWLRSNSDFNRFIQKLRRLHENKIQYLRTIESQRDGYPHFHAILRFPTVLTITNSRYFDRHVYKLWKQSWPHGLSDAQPPRNKKSPLAYIIKYTTKESGHKIWQRYYRHLNADSVAVPHMPLSPKKVDTSFASHAMPYSDILEKYKIKQCTWSRNFFESLLTS